MKIKYYRFFLSILILSNLVACGDIVKNLGPGNNPTGVAPIRVISIQFQENQESEFLEQMEIFSNQHQLEFSLTHYTNQKLNDTFLIAINGQDFHISAFKSVYAQKLDINFFPNDPNTSLDIRSLDDLYNELKTFLSKIPSVVILEEQ